MVLDRETLIDIRESARGMGAGNLNPDWADAYRSLAVAADHLDAMIARTEVIPTGGWAKGIPPNKD